MGITNQSLRASEKADSRHSERSPETFGVKFQVEIKCYVVVVQFSAVATVWLFMIRKSFMVLVR